jgi:tetratricopeptide (TPR) repeat protein
MSRDTLLATFFLATSVVCWAVYASSGRPTGWGIAVLAAIALSAVFAVRTLRNPPEVTLTPVTPARTIPPKKAPTPERLAIHGVRIDPREVHPLDPVRRAIAIASLEHGAAHLESGNTEEALDAFEMLLEDLGTDPAFARTRAAAHALRAMAYERRQDAHLARVEYQRALELDPEQQQAKAALARLG